MANWEDLQSPAMLRTEEQRCNPKTAMGGLGIALRNVLGIDPTKPLLPEFDDVESKED